jgi:hypothetical protein
MVVIGHVQFLFILTPDKPPVFTYYEAGTVWICWRRQKFPAGLETGCRNSLKPFHCFPQFYASLHTVQTLPLFYTHYHPKIYPIILEPKRIQILQGSRERRNKCQNP